MRAARQFLRRDSQESIIKRLFNSLMNIARQLKLIDLLECQGFQQFGEGTTIFCKIAGVTDGSNVGRCSRSEICLEKRR